MSESDGESEYTYQDEDEYSEEYTDEEPEMIGDWKVRSLSLPHPFFLC